MSRLQISINLILSSIEQANKDLMQQYQGLNNEESWLEDLGIIDVAMEETTDTYYVILNPQHACAVRVTVVVLCVSVSVTLFLHYTLYYIK